MSLPPVYLLPGWQNSGPAHWQSRWEALGRGVRIEQADWFWPRRGDWMARLDDILLADARTLATPAVLVAHSLGCLLVAAWAAHSQHTARVQGALLVAPPDIDRPQAPPQITTWRPVPRQRLPFAATAVLSSDDPYGPLDSSLALAADWGAQALVLGPCGHLNADSGLGDWSAGWTLVQALAQR